MSTFFKEKLLSATRIIHHHMVTHLHKSNLLKTTRAIWITWKNLWTNMCYVVNTINIILISENVPDFKFCITKWFFLCEMEHNIYPNYQKKKKWTHIDLSFKMQCYTTNNMR